jgi:hypothetical protein
MKRSIITIAIFPALPLFMGCASKHEANTVLENSAADSVRIEVRERIVLVPDTVYIDIPKQTAERTTLNDSSHLENEYAESDAHINPDGSLFHSLSTKEQKKAVPTNKTVATKDSTAYRDRVVEKTRTETKMVERDFTKWETFCLHSWWILAFVAIGLIAYLIKNLVANLRTKFFCK